MPNSGVFYKSGKFHVSKLQSDLVEFAGQVQATGIALADNQATGQASVSIILPTATQVVDYVQQTVTAGAEYDLASGSASSGESAFAYNAQLADDGAGTVKTEKQRLDAMFAAFAELIADAADESEVRDNTMQTAIAFIDADGTYTAAKLAGTSITPTAVQAFSFPAPAQTTLKGDMEQRFDGIHSAFDSLAKASEDEDDAIQAELDATQASAGVNADGSWTASTGVDYIGSASSLKVATEVLDASLKAEETARIAADDAIEASAGFSAVGAYIAPTWTGGDLQVWDVTANTNAGGFIAFAGSEVTAATTVKSADEILRAMIQENNSAFTTLMAGNGVNFDTLKEIVDAYQLADTEVVDTITKMASRIGLTLSGLNDGNAANQVLTLADMAAVIDNTTNPSGRGLQAIAYDSISMPSLKAMVESSRSAISAHLVSMQTEMDAIETGAGLEVDGAYAFDSNRQYIGSASASSLKVADSLLDDAIRESHERLSDRHGASESLLNKDSFDAANSPAADFALSASYNVVDALNELAQGASSSISDLQAELDRTQASIGFDLLGTNTDGSNYSPAFAASTNAYFATGASLMAVVGDIRTAADVAFKGFEGGTGLGTDGAYSANTNANDIATAVSLQDADNKLDAALHVEETDRIASDTDQLARIGRIITAAGLNAATGSEGAFVAYTGTLLSGAATMYAADVALENEILSVGGDLYANPAVAFGGFSIAGATQSTFEAAINALDTLIGDDADLDVVSDSGSGAVALATESYSLKGGATADANSTINIATSWDNAAKEMSISLDKSPNVEDLTADQQVSAPIMGAHVNVIQEGFEASASISAGAVICLNLGAYTMTKSSCVASVKVADKTVGASNDSRVVGIAFDKTSTQGSVDITKGFVAGEVVSFMTYGIMKGFDLSGCTTPAAGEELYLDSAGKVTNAAPSGDGSATTAYVSIHKIGMILKVGASASDNAIFIDMKHLANEA